MPHTEIQLVSVEEVRAQSNKLLQSYLEDRRRAALQIDESYARLWQQLSALSQAGGKRLRPYMTVLSYQIFSGKQVDAIVAPAAAWELLHLCMLIHDDIIDNDLIRYGVDNIAGSYQKIYQPLESNQARRNHLASGAAILAGDIAMSSAHDMIMQSPLSSDQKVVALKYVTQAIFAVAGGELLDTESVLNAMADTDAAKIAAYKTASYSFVGPLLMGADLAGATASQLNLLRAFATELGCAYQLIDDVLGVFGDAEKTGKTTTGDIREGKHTYLMQYAFEHADERGVATLRSLVGKADIASEEVEQVKTILIVSGAKQAVEDRIQQHIARCESSLAELTADCPKATSLKALMNMAVKRQQ